MVTNEIVMFNKMDAGTLKIFTTDLLSYNISADPYMSTTNQRYLFLRVSNFPLLFVEKNLLPNIGAFTVFCFSLYHRFG